MAYVRVDVSNKPTPRGTFVSGLAELVVYRSVVVIRRDRSCQELRIRRRPQHQVPNQERT